MYDHHVGRVSSSHKQLKPVFKHSAHWQHLAEKFLHFWATVCKTVRPMLSVRCLSCLSVLSVTLLYCGQTVGRIKMKLGMQVGLGPGHIVLDGDPADAPPKGHTPLPQFSAHICCDQMAAWIKMSLGMELGVGPGDIGLHGDPALPFSEGAQTPNFRPIYVAAKWMHGSRCHLVWS